MPRKMLLNSLEENEGIEPIEPRASWSPMKMDWVKTAVFLAPTCLPKKIVSSFKTLSSHWG